MKISICDDDYSVCHFIEHTVLEYAKLKNIHIDVEVTQSKKSLFEKNFIRIKLLRSKLLKNK